MAANFPDFSRLGGDAYDYARGSSKKSESTPELLYKMCKKIAQLTKVVYVLNTRNDDLEMQCKSAAETTEEKVASATAELKRTVSHLKAELEKKIDLNERVQGLEETLKQRDQELRKLLDEIATVRKRQEERERELSCAYRLELREATEAKQMAERRLAEVLAEKQEEQRRYPLNRHRSADYQGGSLKDKSDDQELQEDRRWSMDEETFEEGKEVRRKRDQLAETAAEVEGKKRMVREQEVAEFRRLVEQLQKDLKEKTERWEAVAKEERSKLEAQLERAKAAKEDAEKLLAQQLQTESRNLVSQEARYQEKLTELSGQLAAREAEANRLHLEIEDLKRELVAKASGMDRLQAELAASNKEGEYVKQTLRKLEEDVTGFRHKNTELADELQMKAGEIEALMEEKIKLEEEMKRKEEEEKEEESSDEEEEDEEDKEERRRKEEEANKKVEELERRVRELEGRVTDLSGERERLREEKRRLVAEREEEMRIVQEALDGAIEEKASIQARFERDFETLRTVNTDREQQLLDDFEWKLREVEATCKRRLEERDRTAEERLKAVKEEAEAQLAATKKDLAAAATHEAELAQLRSLSHEQQRSLRAGARQIESLQVSEKILQEEASKLRKLYEREKAHLDSAQANHDKKLADTEKSWRNRLEALKNELNSSWEQRLKKDLARLRTELEAAQQMEKLKIEEEASIKFRAEKRELEKKLKAASDELEQLKASLESKESSWRRDIEKVQANSDRDILDLRRKLDKLDMSYQDKIENMTAQHQKELDKLNEEADQRMAAAEQNWQMQLSSTRTTLELVKEQMERDACKRMEALQDEYQAKLDAQWKRLNEEKEKAVITVEMKFLQQLGILKEEMEKSSSNANAQESEHLHKIINSLKEELSCQTKVIDDLQGNVDTLQGGVQVLNEELNSQSREMEKFQSEAETILRERESQLEAQRLSELEEVRNAHAEEALKWQKEAQTMRDNFQKKAASLCAMLEEWRRKYEARGPRPQDMQTIADLQQALDERERDLSALTEEKRFYQLELAKRKKESFFDSQNSFESTEPVARPRRKGSKLEAGNHNERGADVSSNVGIRGADRGRGSSVGSNTDTLPRQPTGRNSSIQPTVRVRRRDSSPNMSRATQRDETRSSAATPDDHSSSSTTRTRSRSVDLDMIVHPTAAPRTSLPPKNFYVRCSNVRVTPEIRTVPTPPPQSSTDIAPPSTLPICRSPSPTPVISIQVDSSPEQQPDATDSCHSHSPSPPTLISLLTPTHTPTPTPSQFESSNPRPDSSGNDFFDAPLFISEPNLSDNPTPQPDSSGSDFYDAPLYITEPNDSESSPKPVQTTSSHQNVCNSPVPTASAIFDPQPETPAHHPDFPSPPSSPTNLSYREDGLVVVSGSLGLEIAPSTSNSLNPPVPAPPDPTPPK